MSEERSNLELLHEAKKHAQSLSNHSDPSTILRHTNLAGISMIAESIVAIITMLEQREIARTSIQLAHCEPTL